MKNRYTKIFKFFCKKNLEDLLKIPNIIDLDKKENWRGNLIVCPTPIGTIKDISLRVYESLLEADIIACEDTRIGKKLFHLINKKQIGESFNDSFNLDLDIVIDKNNEEENNFFKGIENKLTKKENDYKLKHPNLLNIKRDKVKNQDFFQEDYSNYDKLKAENLLKNKDTLNFLTENNNEEEDIYQYNTKFFDSKKRKKRDKESLGIGDDFIDYIKDKVFETKLKTKRGILISCNKYNEKERIPLLIKAMKGGLKVALISDAGTPVISDPGNEIINASLNNNIVVDSLPGASAITTALGGCGFPCDKFKFEGYSSKTWSQITISLDKLKIEKVTTLFFVNKNRLKNLLLEIIRILGDNQIIYLGIELTKLHERNIRGTVKEIYDNLNENPENLINPMVKGEITVIIAPYIYKYNKDLINIPKNNNNNIQINNEEEEEKASNEIYRISSNTLIYTLLDSFEIDHKTLSVIVANILNIPKKKAYSLITEYKNNNKYN